MKQEMMGLGWHQLHYMQIISTSLQTDNPARTFRDLCQKTTDGESVLPQNCMTLFVDEP